MIEIVSYQVRASAVFALGTLLDVGSGSCRDGNGGDEEYDDDEKIRAEISIVRSLLTVVSDGSPLVRAEVAVGMCWSIFILIHGLDRLLLMGSYMLLITG